MKKTYLFMLLFLLSSFLHASDLLDAVKAGQLSAVKLLLEHHQININEVDDRQYTALMHASLYGYLDVVRYLLTIPTIDIGYQNNKKETASSLASFMGHVEILTELINTMKERGQSQDTEAIIAARYGHVETMKKIVAHDALKKSLHEGWEQKVLLEKGRCGTHYACHLQNPLAIAIRNRQVALVEILAPHMDLNKPLDKGGLPLFYALSYLATRHSNNDGDKGFIDHKKTSDEPLRDAQEIITILIKNGADIFYIYKGGTIISYVMDAWLDFVDPKNSKIEIDQSYLRSMVTTLLDALKKDEIKFKEILGFRGLAIKYASLIGDEALVKILLQNGSGVGDIIETKRERKKYSSQWKDTALMLASKEGHLSLVKLLVERGADIYKTKKDKKSALHYALCKGNIDIVNFLITKGVVLKDISPDFIADIAYKKQYKTLQWIYNQGIALSAENNNRPILCATRSQDYACLKFLLANSAHKPRYALDRALYDAAHSGLLEQVKLLLKHNACFDLGELCSPLLCAARYGHVETVKFLLTCSEIADKEKNKDDLEHVLCLAANHGQLAMVSLLLDYGVEVNALLHETPWPDEYKPRSEKKIKECMCGRPAYGTNTWAKKIFDNESTNNKKSALAWALQNDHVEVVMLLVHRGAKFLEKSRGDLYQYLDSHIKKWRQAQQAKSTIEMSLCVREVLKDMGAGMSGLEQLFDGYFSALHQDPCPQLSQQEIEHKLKTAKEHVGTQFSGLFSY